MCACSWKYRHILFFEKNISIRWRNVCFSDIISKTKHVEKNISQNGVIETHISPSDRNIFSKKKYVAISPWAGAHNNFWNFLLSAIRRSNRQNVVISVGILFFGNFFERRRRARIDAENGHRRFTRPRLRIINRETRRYPTGYLRAPSGTVKYGHGPLKVSGGWAEDGTVYGYPFSWSRFFLLWSSLTHRTRSFPIDTNFQKNKSPNKLAVLNAN